MVAVRYEQSRPASYPFPSRSRQVPRGSSKKNCSYSGLFGSFLSLTSRLTGHVSVSPVDGLPNIPLPLQRIKPGPGREDPLASPQR